MARYSKTLFGTKFNSLNHLILDLGGKKCTYANVR